MSAWGLKVKPDSEGGPKREQERGVLLNWVKGEVQSGHSCSVSNR